MTVVEAAEKWGMSTASICRWARQGLIPVKREKGTKGPGNRWMIADDAICPKKFEKRKPPEPKPKRPPDEQLLTHAGYVAKYGGTKSIKQIADALGITRNEVRRLYERAL